MALKRSRGEKIFNVINIIGFGLFSIVLLVPMIYILRQSLDVGVGKAEHLL